MTFSDTPAPALTYKEFMAKYGEVEVTFSRYFKYVFTYSATLPGGKVLEVHCGGSSEDIYNFEVSNNETLKVSMLGPDYGYVYKNTAVVESFS